MTGVGPEGDDKPYPGKGKAVLIKK